MIFNLLIRLYLACFCQKFYRIIIRFKMNGSIWQKAQKTKDRFLKVLLQLLYIRWKRKHCPDKCAQWLEPVPYHFPGQGKVPKLQVTALPSPSWGGQQPSDVSLSHQSSMFLSLLSLWLPPTYPLSNNQRGGK